MDEKLVKKALTHLEPSKEQSEEMWKKIEMYQKSSSEARKAEKKQFLWKRAKRTGWVYRLAMGFAAVVFAASTVAIADAATGGAISHKIGIMINKTIGKEEEKQIVDQAGDLSEQDIEVYASDILYMDEELLLFENMRGIIVYDLQKDAVLGTIDTQAIDCIYFDGDKKETCVYKEGNSIYVFNTEQKEVTSPVYEYQWKKRETMTLVRSIDKSQAGKKFYQKWKKTQNYVDTYDTFIENATVDIPFNCDDKDCNCRYSKSSLVLDNKVCFLYMKDKQYYLCTATKSGTEFSKAKLALPYTNKKEETDEKKMPEFTYTGDEAEIASIVKYMKEEARYDFEEEKTIWIPSYVIYGMVEKDGEVLVFGNFYDHTYHKIGNVLQESSGGEDPACFHLKKVGDGFEVVSVDHAGDGEDYAKDIKEFTKGYPGLYEKYMDWEENETMREEARKKYIKMYIEQNSLDVKYYKDYGWDPVKVE